MIIDHVINSCVIYSTSGPQFLRLPSLHYLQITDRVLKSDPDKKSQPYLKKLTGRKTLYYFST